MHWPLRTVNRAVSNSVRVTQGENQTRPWTSHEFQCQRQKVKSAKGGHKEDTRNEPGTFKSHKEQSLPFSIESPFHEGKFCGTQTTDEGLSLTGLMWHLAWHMLVAQCLMDTLESGGPPLGSKHQGSENRKWPLMIRNVWPMESNKMKHCPLLLCVLQSVTTGQYTQVSVVVKEWTLKFSRNLMIKINW